MSDIMLNAVIQMPYEMVMKDELSRRQFYERANQALNERNSKEAEIEQLREALQKVRPVIAADRQGLLDCHGIHGKIPAEDELGTYGLYEYDGALHVIDAALSGEPNGSN